MTSTTISSTRRRTSRTALLALPLAALTMLAPGCADHVQPASPSNAGPDTTSAAPTSGNADRIARSDSLLAKLLKSDQPGCTAAVGRNGTVVWAGARGVANLQTGAPITPDTVMDIASTSKQFTATAILLLADQHKLRLSDPVSRYVPGLPAWADSVTISQLIHHQSGISDYTDLLTADGVKMSAHVTQEQAVRRLDKVPALTFTPGSKYEYSNSNYLLLAEIVNKVSGTPLPQFLDEQVFQPLGLAMVMDPVAKIPAKAISYEAGPSGFTIADSLWEPVGDGAIQTTPSQLVRWADNYRTGRVGGQELLTAQLADPVVDPEEPGAAYAAGIEVLNDGSLEHTGGWAGFNTDFRVSKDRQTSVAMICNSDNAAFGEVMQQLWQIWN